MFLLSSEGCWHSLVCGHIAPVSTSMGTLPFSSSVHVMYMSVHVSLGLFLTSILVIAFNAGGFPHLKTLFLYKVTFIGSRYFIFEGPYLAYYVVLSH